MISKPTFFLLSRRYDNLCFMYRRDLLNALELHHNRIIHEQIYSVTEINPHSFVYHGELD